MKISTKLRDLAASVRKSLAGLKPSADLKNLDAVAKERAVLREKLALVTELEAVESVRMEAEAVAAKLKQRKAFLADVGKRAATVTKAHQQFTDRAASLLNDLVVTLGEREAALNREAVGLETTEAHELLTTIERHELLNSLDRSASSIYASSFGASWYDAVATVKDEYIRARLTDLLPRPQAHHSPLHRASELFITTVRDMAENPPAPPADNEKPTAKPATVGDHYEVDLRTNEPVLDLNAQM